MQNITNYLNEISAKFKTTKTTEHSFRGDLQNFLVNMNPQVQVINEPTRQSCGAPDYIVQKRNTPIGYIEAKDIWVELDKIENDEQLTRYKGSLNNLILTNYLDFRLFRNGEKVAQVKIATVDNNSYRIKPLTEEFEKLTHLLQEFFSFQGVTIKSAEQLANIMAQKAILMRDVFEKIVQQEENNSLKKQMESFKRVLLHNLDEKTFADVYAQTITYGLFVARLNDKTPESFSRQEARELVSKSNPFLRSLFDYIAGANLDENAIWIVDDLVNVFQVADVQGIMAVYSNTDGVKDPFLHFYETFLQAYDKASKKKHGVYYTPQPIVKFIVHAVDDILRTDFGLTDGLADNTKITCKVEEENTGKKSEVKTFKVQILDPATGTGTFLAQTMQKIYEKFRNQQGLWSKYVDEAVIPRLHGFELLMTPYVMCHLKLEMILKETNYSQTTAQTNRFKVYLTNSLENDTSEELPLFAPWLADEAYAAKRVKNNTPIMVVMGNPPYSGESANGKLFCEELAPYKREPNGEKLDEKNPKWINNDYVKFIRYAQMLVDKNKEGIVAYITDNGFLDSPTFRGMRHCLLTSFDKIYILNLHGNARKKEMSPDGGKDENVFDIMQGVSINIFVKTSNKKGLATVHYADLYGTRKDKFDFLQKNTLQDISWITLGFDKEFYFFVPKDLSLQEKYNKSFSVVDLFPVNSLGIVTARDNLCIQHSREEMAKTVAKFVSLDVEDARNIFDLGEDVRDWSVCRAQKDILNSKVNPSNIVPISYRPFDTRYTYFTGVSRGFHCMPRSVMKHFINKDNLSLHVPRQCKKEWKYVFISKCISDSGLTAMGISNGAGNVFPLYIYNDENDQISVREPNFNIEIIKEIENKTGLIFTKEQENNTRCFAPIDVLDYIYGILHSNKYRQKYNELLKIDFPRIPYPKDANYFRQIASLGRKIRELHLLDSPKIKHIITSYPVPGNDTMECLIYKDNKVFINKTQYFAGVPKEAWEFWVGGYQPAQRWLKDRKGQQLSYEDLTHYQQMIVALFNTHNLMQEIDKIIEI
ncbi:type ISP restriction/modification enzyme [Candidatus Avelusimicrobium sp.]